MDTRNLVDPGLAPMLDVMPSFDLSTEALPTVRMLLGAPLPGGPEPALVPDRLLVKGRNGAPDVPLLVFDPPARLHRAAIVHMHGGGMVLGSAAMNSISNAALALSLGVMIVSVDYRLAPETPFPGPQEDCMAALDWLVAVAAERNVDLSRLAVMGESAGAGLAAAVALMARDEGRVALRAQILTYPMLDHRTGTAAQPGFPHTGHFVWSRANNRFGWEALQGGYTCDDACAGWFSPSLAADLSGLPPTFIAVGDLDLFLEENLVWAQRLAAAAVPVELHVYRGAFHGFNMMPGARLTATYDRDLAAAVSAMLLA